MSWEIVNGALAIPARKPDFRRNANKYWFKEMVAESGGELAAALMECPITKKLMVCRPQSGWYYVTEEVSKEYHAWMFEDIILDKHAP